MGDPSNIDIGWRSALMFAVCLPLSVAALMLALRKVERAANLYLAAFLIAVAVSQIPQIIGFANFYGVWPGLTFAPFFTDLWWGPLLYLHADRLMRAGPLGWRKWLILPGILQTLYYSLAFLFLGDYKKKWAFNDAVHEPYIIAFETVFGIAFLVLAGIAVWRLMLRYDVYLKHTQSAARDFDPVWLRRLLIAASLAGVIFAGLEFTEAFIKHLSYVAGYPVLVVITAIVAWIAFEALSQTHIVFPKMPDAFSPEDSQDMDARDWVADGADLKTKTLDGEWFLEPRLSIRDVARRMATNETYISRALNRGLGVSFHGFINDMRITHAQNMIKQGRAQMLEIALASGFNSKATFNRVFRDRTGQTPSQYKKSQKP